MATPSVKDFLKNKGLLNQVSVPPKPQLDSNLKIQAPQKKKGIFSSLVENVGYAIKGFKENPTFDPYLPKNPVSDFLQTLAPSSPEEAAEQGMVNIGSKEKPLYFDYTGVVGNLQKVGVNLTKKVVDQIAKSNVADDIFKLIKGKATDVSDDVLKGLSQKLVNAKTPEAVRSVTDDFLKEASKRAEGLLTRIKPPISTLDNTLAPLTQEARKYKSAEEFVKAQTKSNSWSEAQKTNPDLWNTGILRRSQSSMGAKGVIPDEVHSAQAKWQNYGQNNEMPAKTVYKRIESGSFKGEYEDKLGFPVRDENGSIIRDIYDDATGEWIEPMISNKQLKDNLLESFSTPEGKKYLNEVIDALPKNPDGTVTAYRIGAIIGDGPQSYTLSEGMAKTFSNQGTDIPLPGTPGLPKGGYKDFGALPANMVKIDPKGIKAWSPYDAEILVEPKFVKTKSQLTDIWNEATKNSIPSPVKSKLERGFTQSAKEIVPDAKKIAGQYIPRSTDQLAIKAKNLIKTDIATAERIALTQSDDNAVAIASELLKKYADDAAKNTDTAISSALYDKAAEVANTLAPKLTEQGRAIQAASILGRLTPEGQVKFAAREIQKYNELNPTKRIKELGGAETKYITEEMKGVNNMADGTEKAMRFQKLQNYIQELVPTPLIKKVIAVWKAGLLTGVKTSGLNLFSNLSHGITEIAKDIPAAIVDSVASLFTGKRTKTFTLGGTAGGLKEGFQKGFRYLKTGFDERNLASKLDYSKVGFGKGKVAQAFKAYTETVFKVLGASDQPFYYGALARSLRDQVLAQAKNTKLKGAELTKFIDDLAQNPTEEMIRYAVADATTAVFQNKTKLGEIAKGVQKLGGGLGEVALPFGRTPSAVAMQIVNYSPAGIIKTIVENIGKGKFDQRLFSQGIGRGLVGTGVLLVGAELYKKGMVALDYPAGDEREQELQKAEGVKNNSIKIGGKWRTPVILGPAGNVLLIGAHFQKALEESGSASEAIAKALSGGAKSFTEQTFLTGLEDLINALTNPERYAQSYLPNLIASFVPTLASDIAKAGDSKERRNTGSNVVERTVDSVKSRLPFARNTLEPQVDILGRERERVGNPLETLVDPTRPSKDVSTPVTDELRRLTDSGFRVSPTMLGDRSGYKVLSKEENTRLWELAGGVVNDKLASLFGKQEYLELSDEQKGKIVEKVIDQAKVNARAGMAIELTEGLSGEELKSKLSELKAGGLLTKEVFKKYQELR
jgi:hypothetical protein